MTNGLKIAIALAAFCGTSTLAHARPPTVTNSPGYDARLQESRKALGDSQAVPVPATPSTSAPKHSKKKHTN